MSVPKEMKRSFQVDIDIVSTHTYIIDEVNSQEEAEEVARQYLADGEEGTINDVEEYNIDSYPIEVGDIN
jgi:hypothetical protein